MKNNIFLFFSLILTSKTNGQVKDSTYCFKRDSSNSYVEYCYTSTKQLKYTIFKTNNHRNVINFYPNGQIKSQGMTINLNPAGYYLSFFENGIIQCEGYYTIIKSKYRLNSKVLSEYIDDNGFIDSGDTSIMVVENSEYKIPQEGVWKYYYSSGKLRQLCIYKKHKMLFFNNKQIKEGVWEFYNEEGKLIRKTHYKNDKILKIELF
ncbi:MAG: hypothetical protein Q8R57_15180 [Bacteroidota bacterium]|nr:hypothetical protein [Bacteroidota bacterium]